MTPFCGVDNTDDDVVKNGDDLESVTTLSYKLWVVCLEISKFGVLVFNSSFIDNTVVNLCVSKDVFVVIVDVWTFSWRAVDEYVTDGSITSGKDVAKSKDWRSPDDVDTSEGKISKPSDEVEVIFMSYTELIVDWMVKDGSWTVDSTGVAPEYPAKLERESYSEYVEYGDNNVDSVKNVECKGNDVLYISDIK